MRVPRWDNLVWPQWLPEKARMPLVAQISGAVALTALIMGPWWSRVPSDGTGAAATSVAPQAPAAPAVIPEAAPAAVKPAEPVRPAHLNLDVRHSFASVDLTVTVDGKRALQSTLEGSGKKFRMFGKRPERSFTRTLDLEPGVRVVQVRLRAPEDRFEQTRVERFELGSAQVATLRLIASENGMTASADKPPVMPQTAAMLPIATPAATPTPSRATAAATTPPPAGGSDTPVQPSQQQVDALATMLNSLRSMLIAIAGFVATTSAGFVLEQFLGAKKKLYEAKRSTIGGTPEQR